MHIGGLGFKFIWIGRVRKDIIQHITVASKRQWGSVAVRPTAKEKLNAANNWGSFEADPSLVEPLGETAKVDCRLVRYYNTKDTDESCPDS